MRPFPSIVLKASKPPRFRDLRVRTKLIVLHNVFFVVLAGAAYWELIPRFRDHASEVRRREAALAAEVYLRRAAGEPNLPAAIAERLADAEPPAGLPLGPDEIAVDPDHPGEVYWRDPSSGRVSMLRLADEDAAARLEIGLLAALGLAYVAAVVSLELFLMPRYVFRPIRATLAADQAAQAGDRGRELIPDEVIPGDEIGDIMRSRNATIGKLREQEAAVERAVARLEELASDLRSKNEQLESARREMAAQDRLATIGLLGAGVAHELNTPLSIIRGTVEKMLESECGDEVRRRLERVARVTERLRRISESLLDFSAAHENEARRPVRPRGLLDEAWGLLALDERAARIEFRNEVDAEATVLGDYDRLMQVFVNLLRNGVLAIEGAGSIAARSTRRRVGDRDCVSIIVEDSGPGIPEPVLANLFDAFVSTRLDSHGTGLGLTVAEGIVRRHGGEITASNRPEGGARLEVTLPAA